MDKFVEKIEEKDGNVDPW